MAKPTYISSLITDDDAESSGLVKNTDSGIPLFVGNVYIKTAIVFPDGSAQTSAGVALPDIINSGTF
jgi:hypothetical protein